MDLFRAEFGRLVEAVFARFLVVFGQYILVRKESVVLDAVGDVALRALETVRLEDRENAPHAAGVEMQDEDNQVGAQFFAVFQFFRSSLFLLNFGCCPLGSCFCIRYFPLKEYVCRFKFSHCCSSG